MRGFEVHYLSFRLASFILDLDGLGLKRFVYGVQVREPFLMLGFCFLHAAWLRIIISAIRSTLT